MWLKRLQEAYDIIEGELDEMFIHGDVGSSNIIAFRGHIWLFDKELSGKDFNLMMKEMGIDEFSSDDDVLDEMDVIDAIRDRDRSDVLIGILRDKVLYLSHVGGFTLDPKSSILIKKVVKALKLKSVEYSDDLNDNSVKVNKNKIKGEIGNIGYHGTASKYLEGILRKGLQPMSYQSNYAKAGIIHDDKIFFTTRFGEASSHAVTTGNNTKSKPVVLELIIPDKNLIIADYDIDVGSGHTAYQDYERPKNSVRYKSDKSLGLSREFGVYGYLGKILPQHIKSIYILVNESDTPALSDYKKFTKKQIKKILDMYGNLEDFIG